MTTVRIEIRGVENRLESVAKQLPCVRVESNRIVMTSPLDASLPLNDHLVWLWGMLKLKRKFLKGLQADGARLVCVCHCPKGTVKLKANAAEMLHLLGMDLQIEAR